MTVKVIMTMKKIVAREDDDDNKSIVIFVIIDIVIIIICHGTTYCITDNRDECVRSLQIETSPHNDVLQG